MCIAILKTKKGIITDEELRESFRSNPDGAGIAYTQNNELKIVKGIFNADKFVEIVREAEKICDNNMLIHCRIGTSGKKDGLNTHPFRINQNTALIHNGILDINVPKGSSKNDTQLFIENFLKDISSKDLMHNSSVHKLIGMAIGLNNKFVLLDNTGYYKIINEKQGHWKNNVWFSNNSYKPFRGVYFNENIYDDEYPYQQYFNGFQKSKSLYKQDLLDNLVEQIAMLTLEDFKELGDYPCVETDTYKLVPDNKMNEFAHNYEYLDCLSDEMYGFYLDCKKEAEETAKGENYAA